MPQPDSLPLRIQLIVFGLATSLFTLAIGNLLLLDEPAAQVSFIAWLVSQAVLLAVFAIWTLSGSLAAGVALVFGLLSIPVFVQVKFVAFAVYALAPVGAVQLFKSGALRQLDWIQTLLLAGVAALLILGVRWYTSFDMESRSHLGDLHKDTLYHASVAAMLKTYGVVSSGLNGLLETPYHSLSHAVVASGSFITGIPVLESYGTFPQLLLSPLLLICMTAAVVEVSRIGKPLAPSVSVPAAWMTICILLVVLPFLFGHKAVWDSFFRSESYLVALILFLPVMSLLLRNVLSPRDWGLVVLSGVLAVMAKGSVGVMLCGMAAVRLVYVVISTKVWKEAIGTAILCTTVAIFARNNAVSNSFFFEFEPFHFVHFHGISTKVLAKFTTEGLEVTPSAWLGLIRATIVFFLAHFLLSWFVLIWWMQKSDLKTIFTDIRPLLVAATFAVGAAMAISLKIQGGSLYYFTNIPMIVALPVAVAIIVPYLPQLERKRQIVTYTALILFIVLLVGVRLENKSMINRPEIATENSLVTKLTSLRDTTPKDVVLKVGKKTVPVKMNPLKDPIGRPLIYPAISERAWVGVIKGLPCGQRYYGYEFYAVPGETKRKACYGKKRLPPDIPVVTAP